MNDIMEVEEILVSPPVYNLRNLKSVKLQESDQCMSEWGWIKILDLFQCINHIFVSKGIPTMPTEPLEIFKRYGLLCGRKNDQALLTWIGFDYYRRDSKDLPLNSPDRRPEQWGIYIPAGWANRIISVAKCGIVLVTTEVWVRHHIEVPPKVGFFGLKQQEPFLGPFLKCQLVGHAWKGHKTILVCGGEGGSTTAEIRSLTLLESNCGAGIG